MNPVLRRMQLEIWYAEWNEANQRARAAYYERLEELERGRLCRRGLHPRPEGRHGGCSGCRRENDRASRAGYIVPAGAVKLTAAQLSEIVALYNEQYLTPEKISRRFRISRNATRNILISQGVKLRNKSEAAILGYKNRTTQPEQENLSA